MFTSVGLDGPSHPPTHLAVHPCTIPAPQTHLPGYVANLDKYKAAGADVVVFTAVNDPYVMTEWGVVSNAIGKVRREAG